VIPVPCVTVIELFWRNEFEIVPVDTRFLFASVNTGLDAVNPLTFAPTVPSHPFDPCSAPNLSAYACAGLTVCDGVTVSEVALTKAVTNAVDPLL
jgi:hypothetical protein